jgi:hypothetical protein
LFGDTQCFNEEIFHVSRKLNKIFAVRADACNNPEQRLVRNSELLLPSLSLRANLST